MKIRKLSIYIILLIVILSACGKTDDNDENNNNDNLDNLNASGMPIVNESITLEFFGGRSASTADDWNDLLLFNKYGEKTNVDVKWNMVDNDSVDEKRNLTLASNSLPDVLYSSGIPSEDISRYSEQGVIIPLNDLIDEYAPNLKALLEEYPEVEKALTFPDGNIYSFPQMTEPEFLSLRMGPKPWINEEWLEELGLDMPETLDDFYEYLKAVQKEQPNGDSTVPYGAPQIDTLFSYLRGAFGLANKGSNNPHIDLEPESDDLRFYPISAEYKQLLEYVHKLYDEKLIEQNIFSIEHSQYLANATDGMYGSTVWYDMNQEAGGVFDGMPALEGPEGNKSFTTLSSPAINISTFLITNDNAHPEATVRWIDHWYSDEGMKEFFMGYEGETYEINEEGELEYMDHILNSEDGLTRDQELAKYLIFPGGGYPAMLSEKYFEGAENSEDELAAAAKLEPDLVEESWSAFIYTKEETDRLSSIRSDIDKYVEEMRDKFISGTADFDEWDDYVKTLEDMNLDEFMEINEAAYERYLED